MKKCRTTRRIKTSSQADELEQAVTPTAKLKTPALDQYTINLTEKRRMVGLTLLLGVNMKFV